MGRRSLLTLGLALASTAVSAGGAWVPEPGHGHISLGFSRKASDISWDARGDDRFTMVGSERHSHDFRYPYLYAEFGIVRNVAVQATLAYLYGLEGAPSHYEKNTGLTDAWIGFKYQVARGRTPMALGLTHRTPYLYDLPGAYSRYLFDSKGERRGVSPEWRGVLKHDFSLSYLASRSFQDGAAWSSLEAGHTWRTGAPTNQLFVNGEFGYPLRVLSASIKAHTHLEYSLGDSAVPEPEDRFSMQPGSAYNFNDASYLKAGASLIVPFGRDHEWAAELGFARWLWGRSARKYNEPFVSLGRRF